MMVMGAGRIGNLFGGLLTLGREDVWLVDIWKQHNSTIEKACNVDSFYNKVM